MSLIATADEDAPMTSQSAPLHRVTYSARHATHFAIEQDKLASAARDLISGLEDVTCIRTAFPGASDIARFNRQQAEIAGLMQAYIEAVHIETRNHGLEEDGDGDLVQCEGFDCRTWRLPVESV
jgi:hypothetical protein